MEESFQRLNKIRRTDGISADNAFLTGKSPMIIPANSNVSILIDQEYLTTAFPVVDISSGKGSKIKVSYAEALFDSKGNKTKQK